MRFLSFLFVLLLMCPVSFDADANAIAYELSKKDQETLHDVEVYLNNVHTIAADFTQVAPNGNISSGKFYLARPGKLRMEYAPPTPVLMITSGRDIVYYDKELDQVSRISLDSTLVGFLARSDVKFDNSVTITNLEKGEHVLRISLVQTKHPKDGMLTLEFSDHPLTLHNMIVTDSAGQITTVSLSNARFDIALDEKLFIFHDPRRGARHIQK